MKAKRTIWHRGQFDTEDNLTPSCKIGQFDTIMQNRTIWHCEKFSPTVLKKVVIGQQCISNDIFGPNSCQEIKYVFMCGPCRAWIWYRLIIQDNFQLKIHFMIIPIYWKQVINPGHVSSPIICGEQIRLMASTLRKEILSPEIYLLKLFSKI